MFDKLRWKLTIFNTAITGSILLCLAALCLSLSGNNIRQQTLRRFSDTAQAVASYLSVQTQLSDQWMGKMEADPNLSMMVYDNGEPLFSMKHAPEKEALLPCFLRARTLSEGRQGFFTLDQHWAGVFPIEKDHSQLELVMLYALEDMESELWHQRLVVLVASFGAVVALGVFSWMFTGKMLRPIQENQQAQTEFVAAASHELRTPLAAILSAASAMERAEPVQRSQFSDMIHREGRRMSRLIGDMLTLASADSRHWQLQKEPVELDMLLLEIYEAHYPLAKEKGLELTLSLYEQELPVLKLDRDRIAQVVSILLDNAQYHTPAPGRIELELTVHRRCVRIRVTDQGPGVPDSEKEHIFQRFYRSEQSRSHRGHFGLGLSIASQLVKQHGGRIWVQDAPAGGAEFVVELPN